MSFQFQKTQLEGVLIIDSHVAVDNRGYYRKNFEKFIFDSANLSPEFTECSDIYSRKGVIRGLHFQTESPQAKLIHVISGAIYDVVVDLRKKSPTFGKWEGIWLRENDHKSIYIPEEFAHAYLALEDNTIFSYQCTGKYVPDACGAILYNDKDLNIDWPLEHIDKIILSEKDMQAMTFKEFGEKNLAFE